MEHRWGKRVRTDTPVQIFAHPASMAWGRLRDISVSGGFIETELKIRALSTISMTVLAKGHARDRIARAIVVRRDSDGVGVEWFDGHSDVIASLMQEATMWRASGFFYGEMRL
jgi:PilZ domain-containing protein